MKTKVVALLTWTVGKEGKERMGYGKAKQRAQTDILTGRFALKPGTYHNIYLQRIIRILQNEFIYKISK